MYRTTWRKLQLDVKFTFWLVIRLILVVVFAPTTLYLSGYIAMLAGETAWLPNQEFFIYFVVSLFLFSLFLSLNSKFRRVAIFLTLSIITMVIYWLHIGEKYNIMGHEYTATVIQVWVLCCIGMFHFAVPNRLTGRILILLPVAACGYFLYFTVLRSAQMTMNVVEIKALAKAGELEADKYQTIIESLPYYYLSSLGTGLQGLLLVALYFIASWQKLKSFNGVV